MRGRNGITPTGINPTLTAQIGEPQLSVEGHTDVTVVQIEQLGFHGQIGAGCHTLYVLLAVVPPRPVQLVWKNWPAGLSVRS